MKLKKSTMILTAVFAYLNAGQADALLNGRVQDQEEQQTLNLNQTYEIDSVFRELSNISKTDTLPSIEEALNLLKKFQVITKYVDDLAVDEEYFYDAQLGAVKCSEFVNENID